MIKFFFVVILLAVSLPAHGAQQIIQITKGWCSPTIANVVGDVHIKCIGVSPKAHQKLNEELKSLRKEGDLKIKQLLARAEQWAQSYHEMKQNYERFVTSPKEIKQINQLIVKGEFDHAAARLDEKIKQQEDQIGSLAEIHYLRAGVYQLEFDITNAMNHIKRAYQYQPQNSKYLLSYISTLINKGQLSTAERVLTEALPGLRNRFKNGSIKEALALANALDKLGAIYIQSGRSDHVNELSEETMEVLKGLKDSQLAQKDFLEVAGTIAFSLGRNDLAAGKLDIAERLLGVAFGWNLELCGKKDAHFCVTAAKSISMTGVIDSMKGNYLRAIGRFTLALDTLKVVESSNIVENDLKAQILFSKAEAHLKLGQQREAVENWQAILNTWKEGEFLSMLHRTVIAHSYIKLGELSVTGDNYAQGEAYFKKALSMTKNPESDEVEIEKALALVNFGHMYAFLSKGTLARPYASQAADIFYKYWKANPNEYKSYYARSLFVLGVSSIIIGDRESGCKELSQVHVVESGGTWDNLSLQVRSADCQ